MLAARLARRLHDRYRFVFACLDDMGSLGGQLGDEGFVVEFLRRRPGIDFGCMRRLSRLWRREGIKLVHAHQYTPFFYAMATRQMCRRPPILFTEHGRWFPDYPRRKRLLFNRLALRRMDRVVAVGKSVGRALIHNEGIPSERIEIIYNGVDTVAFDGRAVDGSTVTREIGSTPDNLVIIQVARLDHLKDHLTGIRAMGRIARRRDDVRLVLVGEGPEMEKIEAEIGGQNLEPYVRLLGLRHDVAELLQAADLFLLSSISEGIPVTVIEAMAAGLPVVSTDVGGVAEIVEQGRTGLLAPSGDDAALADAVLQLADDPDLRARMGQQGRRRAEEVFSEKQMHAAYQQCYQEMLRD